MKIYLHRGVEITNMTFTGHPNIIYDSLVKSISAIVRCDRNICKYYVGIASGIDFFEALKRRIDEKKIANNTTRMNLLYQSSSSKNVRDLEERLREKFQDLLGDPRMWNEAKGGGGAPSAQPLFFIYLAVSKVV